MDICDEKIFHHDKALHFHLKLYIFLIKIIIETKVRYGYIIVEVKPHAKH